MYWVWDSSLDVGIEEIDKQHKRIVQYMNEIHDYMERRDPDPEVIGRVIDSMIDYTVTHFAFEEAAMERAGYPILADHKGVHESFAKRMQEHKRQFEAGRDVTRQLLGDLRIWLTSHIKHDDKDYVPLVRKALKEKSWIGKAFGKLFG
ncbi:MAG TPA: bacteriohemerythrin [Acidiferrobacter sp.]|nr:bacteriohemerythrin [Acidiferrobacter sp.]